MSKVKKNIIFIFWLFCFYINSFSQENTSDNTRSFLNLPLSTSFYSQDTILGIPFFSNNDFSVFTKHAIKDFLNSDNNSYYVDFTNYIEDEKEISFK